MAHTPITLTPDTRVLDLIQHHPWLVDRLTELSPKYKALQNPVMRNTVGRVATLRRAAAMGSLRLSSMLDQLAEMIRQQEGVEVIVELTDAAPHDQRLDSLKALILSLHTGEESLDSAKERFEREFGTVPASDIARMEQQLIQDGLPVESIQALCDVHVGVMGGGATGKNPLEQSPGHPIHTFVAENQMLKQITAAARVLLDRLAQAGTDPTDELRRDLTEALTHVGEVEKHYLRKEHLLFPLLEREGFDGPSKVMWAIHDEIRAGLKSARANLEAGNLSEFAAALPDTLTAIDDMVTKEETILFPTALDMLQHEDWAEIHKQEEEIGFCLVIRDNTWSPRIKMATAGSSVSAEDAFAAHHPHAVRRTPDSATSSSASPASLADSPTAPGNDSIDLNTGVLTRHQLDRILLTLPVELSFVDENDEVRYFTGVHDKLFPRTPAVIGRNVQNCHPPKSLHMVNQILAEMKAGTRETATFWMDDFAGKFVYIRYDAVRDEDGRYMGCLESVQVANDIRAAEGSKRLLDPA